MIAEIATALNLLKASSDQLSVLRKIKFDAAVTDKIIESQSAVLSAQSAMFEVNAKYQELLDSNETLKKQLIEKQNWKVETQQYSLKAIDPGIFVYASNPDQQATTPAHWLCINCYQKKQKSILIKSNVTPDGKIFLCYACQNTFKTSVMPDDA